MRIDVREGDKCLVSSPLRSQRDAPLRRAVVIGVSQRKLKIRVQYDDDNTLALVNFSQITFPEEKRMPERTFEAVITPWDIAAAVKLHQDLHLDADTVIRLGAAHMDSLPATERQEFMVRLIEAAAKLHHVSGQ